MLAAGKPARDTMKDISVEDDEAGTLRVTLTRPQRRNAISLAMWGALGELFTRLAGERHVRAVLVTGAGDHFSAGADIAEFERERGDAEAGARYSQQVEACTRAVMALPCPSIAVVSGFCLGGGCGLAMACDFRVAGSDAVFGIPAARLGIIYSITDTRNLVSLVGMQHARELLYTGERIDAARAAEWGLVDEIAPAAPIDAARSRVARLKDSAPLSIAGAKRTLAAVAEGASGESLRALQRQALDSDDYREGVQAFLERRKATFTGA